ncbi:spermatogenesis-associated protein 31A6-like [Choloepus didactylus]|uniref:spermatogenesis-associated protein 31A6-like n=1 Tax=Choloepus didactylus TaxID=27675 RepID=UPI00189FEEB2|nr:spermatogenesis-associated protein 31A6-like [Choloepus didactylus]
MLLRRNWDCLFSPETVLSENLICHYSKYYEVKRQMGTRGRNRRRKKNGALKACRESLQELKETQDLFLLLQSHLGQLPEKGNFHQLLCQDPSAEMCKTAPAEAHLPHEEPIDNAAPAVSPWASTVPLTKPPLPLASKLSPYLTTPSVPGLLHSPLSASQPSEPFLPLDHRSRQPLAPFSPPPPASGSLACPQPPTAFSAPPLIGSSLTLSQHDLMSLPLSASLYNKSWLSASTPTISSFDRSSRPILASSWWWAATKDLFFPTPTHSEFQQEHLSHHSREASFWRGPVNRQVEFGGPSFLNSDVQKLLELQITKTVELKSWKEKKKEGPDYRLNSLGNVFKSLPDEQDSTVPQPFWSTKDKPEQQPSPEKSPNPETLGDHLGHKCSQFFWGLPFLHSESLVATVRGSGSAVEFPSVFFNGISSALPIQMPAEEFSLLSQSQALPHYVVQSQLLIPTMPQPQPSLISQVHFQPQPLAQIQTQVHLSSSLPILVPSSPQIVSCGELWPTSQNESQSLMPIAIQHLECHILKKQKESWRALPFVVTRSQEAFSSLSSNLPQESQASQAHKSVSSLPGDFPVSPVLCRHLEQHLPKRFVQ